MNLGIVKGTVTATIKHPAYQGRTLMVVGLCRPDWTLTGKETLAVDTVQAGIGDRVMVLKEGNSAKAMLGGVSLPLQEMIVAIVDHAEWHDPEQHDPEQHDPTGEGAADVSQ